MGLSTELELRALKQEDNGKTIPFGKSMSGKVTGMWLPDVPFAGKVKANEVNP